MSKKHFSWLLALTLIAGAIILLMPGKTGHESGFEVRPLIPGMDKWVNDVTRVRITKSGNQAVATLNRGENGWVVEEAQSYPADWVKLKTMLAALAQAQVIELKTANPAYFEKLGLKDVKDDASTALMVELDRGDTSTTLLIGHGAQGRQGQYVRMSGDDQALLIDRPIEVAGDTKDWLDRSIVEVDEAEVVEVTITHPDGEQIKVRKNSADDKNFTLLDLPEGREIQSSWGVNGLGASLSGLQLEDVTADSNVDWSQAAHLTLLTAGGLELAADLAKSGEISWIRLAAAVHKPKAQAAEQEPSEAQGDSAGQTAEDAAVVAASEELGKRVESINHRVSGWAYAIPQYKAEVIEKRLEDLLKPLEKN